MHSADRVAQAASCLLFQSTRTRAVLAAGRGASTWSRTTQASTVPREFVRIQRQHIHTHSNSPLLSSRNITSSPRSTSITSAINIVTFRPPVLHPKLPSRRQARSIFGSKIPAKMSGLFQATITNPAQVQGKPEDAAELRHHLKGGKGFCNPWESFRDENLTFFLRHIFW